MRIINLKREVLRVVPETLEELLAVLHFKRVSPETDEYLDLRLAFRNKEKVEIDVPGTCVEAGGGWARAEVTTDFLNPYWECLEKRLDAQRFNFDLLPGLRLPGLVFMRITPGLKFVGYDIDGNSLAWLPFSAVMGQAYLSLRSLPLLPAVVLMKSRDKMSLEDRLKLAVAWRKNRAAWLEL